MQAGLAEWLSREREPAISYRPEAQASLLHAQLMCVVGVEQAQAARVQTMGLHSSLWVAVVHRAAFHVNIVLFCPRTLICGGALGLLGIWGSLSHRG